MKLRSFLLPVLLFFGIAMTNCTTKKVQPFNCYYIDSSLGNDTNSGTNEDEAWKTVSKLKQIQLEPGDHVLFKKGTKNEGVIDLTAKGSSKKPIVIGSYGNNEAKPVLAAPDSSLFTIRIKNSEYITLKDLEIINQGSKDLASRTGVKIESTDYGVSKGIHLKNLFIHDVNGVITKWNGGGSGILIINGGKERISTFDSLTIEYCHIKNCQRNAMIWTGYSDRTNWHPSTNVWIHHNLIEEVPGDGIVPIGCDGAIIEYNVMRRGTNKMLVSSKEAAAGIWPWASDNTIIRYNEVSEHKGTWDGQGFDADYNCINTVIEYNYSHGNDGGLALICSSGEEDKNTCEWCIGTEKPVLRYNISIGDGNRPFQTRGKWFSPSIHIAGPVRGAMVYRNIIHNKVKAAPEIDGSMIISDDWSGYADSTIIKENIFYTPEVSRFDFSKSTNNRFEYNYYLGTYRKMPAEEDVKELAPKYADIISNPGREGLLQFMDSVSIAGNAKCIFVNKDKIEKFFDTLLKERNK